jgi:hypothetical protein
MVEATEKSRIVDVASSSVEYRAGDVVGTAYGVGVIVQAIQKPKRVNHNDNDDDDSAIDFFAVRLWRIPGKSMGSSALAFLQPSTVCVVCVSS